MKKFNVAFLGRGKLGMEVLRALTQESKVNLSLIISCSATPEVEFTQKDFRIIAERQGIPFYETDSVNSSKYEEILKSHKLDLVVAMLWLNTISEELVSTSRMGFLNLHGGALPRYRGNACQSWAILNGERGIGVTCHLMKGGELDSGPIIKQQIIEVKASDRVGDLFEKVEAVGAELVISSVRDLLDGNAMLIEQEESNALYCYPRLPRDGEVNWNNSAHQISTLVRAAGKPYGGAYSWFSDIRDNGKLKKLTIWDAKPEAHLLNNFNAVPGHVLKLDRGEKWGVVCGDENLLILNEIDVDEIAVNPSLAFRSVRQRLGLDVQAEISGLHRKVEHLELIMKEHNLFT